MQLSWIDPEALRDLAAKLQDPAPSAPRGLQSEPFHTLGAFKAIETDVFGFRLATEPVGGTPPSPTPPAVSAASAPVPAPAPPQPPAPEPQASPHPSDEQVARIREQLQIIRSKAVQAGLLQPEPPPLASPAPEPAVSMGSAVAPSPLGVPSMPSLPPVSESAPAMSAPAASAPPPLASQNLQHFLPLEGDLGHRLESYGQWASHRAPAEEMLLVDDHGDVLWGTVTRSDLAFSALLSLNAALRSSADGVCHPPAVIRSRIAENRELTVLPCGTRHGTVTLAMLNAQPVSDSTLDLLREGLVTAVEGR